MLSRARPKTDTWRLDVTVAAVAFWFQFGSQCFCNKSPPNFCTAWS